MSRTISPASSPLDGISAKATAAVTNNPAAGVYGSGLFFKLDTDNNYFVLTGVGDTPDGWLDCNVLINANGTLEPLIGRKLVKLAGTVTAGDYGECAANGKVVKATGLRPVVCRFLDSGVSGDFVSAQLMLIPVGGISISGAAVASASAIVPTGNVFHVTGTTAITSVTSTGISAGARMTLIFDASLTFTDGNNLKIGGDFSATADDTISLVYDGTNWYEAGARSAN